MSKRFLYENVTAFRIKYIYALICKQMQLKIYQPGKIVILVQSMSK